MSIASTSESASNRIILNRDEVVRVFQHYCKTVLFKPSACPEVESVRQLNDGVGPLHAFEVTLSKIPTP